MDRGIGIVAIGSDGEGKGPIVVRIYLIDEAVAVVIPAVAHDLRRARMDQGIGVIAIEGAMRAVSIRVPADNSRELDRSDVDDCRPIVVPIDDPWEAPLVGGRSVGVVAGIE